jgi:Tetracyclin repressor-like, C-terminal domain
VATDFGPSASRVTSEADTAARVLLTATGGVHHHAVSAQKEILLEATPPGQVWLTGDLDGLAYLLVRIYESTFYADPLANRPPDQDLAKHAIRALLAPSPTGRQ